MNLEQLREHIQDVIIGELPFRESRLAAERDTVTKAIEELREVAQTALEFMPEGNSIIEIVEARNDLIDAFNLSYDQ